MEKSGINTCIDTSSSNMSVVRTSVPGVDALGPTPFKELLVAELQKQG